MRREREREKGTYVGKEQRETETCDIKCMQSVAATHLLKEDVRTYVVIRTNTDYYKLQ